MGTFKGTFRGGVTPRELLTKTPFSGSGTKKIGISYPQKTFTITLCPLILSELTAIV